MIQEKSQSVTDAIKTQKAFNPIRGAIKRANRFAVAVVRWTKSPAPTLDKTTNSPAATDLLKIKAAASKTHRKNLPTPNQSALQSLNEALSSLSPSHGLTPKQLKDLHQGELVCTLALNERQQNEGTRFLPTTTVYQLVDVDPTKFTPKQAAELFRDPNHTQTLMRSKQCLKTPEIIGNDATYTLKNGTLTAKVQIAALPNNPAGH